jgi:hypothetical protein
MFENRVLRRIFEPKKDEVTGEWGEVHSEELNELYCSTNILRVNKWRRMRQVGHVRSLGERRDVYRILVGNLREIDHLKNTGIDGSVN